MSDSGSFFSCEDLKSEVYALRKEYSSFFDKLRRIPHLPLPSTKFNPEIITEIQRINEWVPCEIESDYWSEEDRFFFAQSNLIRTLIEFIPDSRFAKDTNSKNRPVDKVIYREDGRVSYFDTDLLAEMPYTKELIYSFTDYPKRTRLVKIPGKYEIPTHSHHNYGLDSSDRPYFMGVIQVPIISEKTTYHVSKTPDSQSFDKVYSVGEAYLFNSYHFHHVINHSDEDRITLFITIDLEYRPNILALRPLVDAYNGPLI